MMLRDPKQKNMLDMFSQNVQDPASYFETPKVDQNRVQAIKNKMSNEQMQTLASRNKLNKEVASGGIVDNSGPIEDGQLAQTLASRDKLNNEIASGGIVDNSGPIGKGMVESGKMSQSEFDKSFKNEDMSKNNDSVLGSIGKALKEYKPEKVADAPEAYRFGDVGAGVQLSKTDMEARRSAIAKLSGGGVY